MVHPEKPLDKGTDDSVVAGKVVEGLQINGKSEHLLYEQPGLVPRPLADPRCRFHGNDQFGSIPAVS